VGQARDFGNTPIHMFGRTRFRGRSRNLSDHARAALLNRALRSCCTKAIISAISLVALVVRSASFQTSSATTAKPRPCSPARAASMAALRESC